MCGLCGYDPFWIYEQRLEQEYLDRMEEDMQEFISELKGKTDVELSQLLQEAEDIQNTEMWQKVTEEMNISKQPNRL